MIDVLVVDDDPHLRKLTLFALRLDPELAPRACASGEEALAAVAEAPPAIVLLDLDLPDLDGRVVAERIAVLAPATKLIFCTGAERATAAGACGVIKKPFDPLTLAAEVRRLTAPREAG